MGDSRLNDVDLFDDDIDELDPQPTWLFICSCGFKCTMEALGNEEVVPKILCPMCGKFVKGGF